MRSVPSSPLVPKFHLYMINVLLNLSAESDDSCPDEPLFFKETMLSPYWEDFKKAMPAKFQSLFKIDNWEYKKKPWGQTVLTGR